MCVVFVCIYVLWWRVQGMHFEHAFVLLCRDTLSTDPSVILFFSVVFQACLLDTYLSVLTKDISLSKIHSNLACPDN